MRDKDLSELLASEKWHRPYGLALIETNPVKLRELVAESEESIFLRYLELRGVPGSEIQLSDLGRAIDELIKLIARLDLPRHSHVRPAKTNYKSYEIYRVPSDVE